MAVRCCGFGYHFIPVVVCNNQLVEQKTTKKQKKNVPQARDTSVSQARHRPPLPARPSCHRGGVCSLCASYL